jgi:hypothetical protein
MCAQFWRLVDLAGWTLKGTGSGSPVVARNRLLNQIDKILATVGEVDGDEAVLP